MSRNEGKRSVIRKAINLDEVKSFIHAQSPQTKVYIGGDSDCFRVNGKWFADYTLVVVVHIDGCHGCRIFGEVVREPIYDTRKEKPRFRLMTEVAKIAELYLKLDEVLRDREVEVHLDINPNEHAGSSCVIQEATGYIRGMCNVTPMVKPNAFAASYAADRLKEIIREREVA
jgi:predicted RNase H-related nuclease YkuK (DUF458 family)